MLDLGALRRGDLHHLPGRVAQCRQEGKAFLEVADGWLDCAATGLDGLESLGEGAGCRADGAVRVSRTGPTSSATSPHRCPNSCTTAVLDRKALLDLTVPGYLGTDAAFAARHAPADQAPERGRREELARLVSPFTLRRLKSAVLHELPDKIRDVRTCRLAGEQVRLYREAVAARSGALLEALGRDGQPVPYLHVFALLSTLKQICNHPALLQPSVDGYERMTSGKWELFVELLAASLDSGQNVVVFAHFPGMIEIMERHLRSLEVGFASLTGRSRNRGKLLHRFQEDPQCRVFLASLKAGGAGIDLVAGSAVIHYDRWWNAVAEDDPGLLKAFSRKDLAALLAPPD